MLFYCQGSNLCQLTVYFSFLSQYSDVSSYKLLFYLFFFWSTFWKLSLSSRMFFSHFFIVLTFPLIIRSSFHNSLHCCTFFAHHLPCFIIFSSLTWFLYFFNLTTRLFSFSSSFPSCSCVTFNISFLILYHLLFMLLESFSFLNFVTGIFCRIFFIPLYFKSSFTIFILSLYFRILNGIQRKEIVFLSSFESISIRITNYSNANSKKCFNKVFKFLVVE